MAKGIEKDSVKRTSRKVDSGEAGVTSAHENLEAVQTGSEDHVEPSDLGTLGSLPTSEIDHVSATHEEPSHVLVNDVPVQDVQTTGGQVQLISPDKFKEQIDGLRQSGTIKNDKDEEVPFDGETKEEFIKFCEEGYFVVEKMMAAVYETGKFLHEVRKILKPKKLFLTWMNFTGLQERRSYRYMKVYERFGERLPDFAHLGIRKLLAATHLKKCVEYLDEHREDAETQTAEQFEQTIRDLIANKKKKGAAGRKPLYEAIAGYKMRRSEDGKKLVIDGLSKKRQNELFEAIKALLLADKGRT